MSKLICEELKQLRTRFVKVYEAFPFFNEFYTREEIERSLKTIKCDVAYPVDLEANDLVRIEYEQLRSKLMNSDLTNDELDKMDEISQYLASTIVKEEHIHSGGCHALWVLNSLLKKWEQDDLLVKKLISHGIDTKEQYQELMEFYKIYQQSTITGKDLENQVEELLHLSNEKTAKYKAIIDDIFPILFSYLHKTALTDDVIRVISFILLLHQSLSYARENPSKTNMFNKINSLKYKYLKGTTDFHSVIGEVLAIGLLAKSGILREIELATVQGKKPDVIIEIEGEIIELEIYSPTTPSFITQLKTIGEKKVRTAFAYDGLANEEGIIRKINRKQLSQTKIGFFWIYSAYGFDRLDEYEELIDLIDFGKNDVKLDFVSTIEGSENINGLIVTDLINLSNLNSSLVVHGFGTENFDLEEVNPLLNKLVGTLEKTTIALKNEILGLIGNSSIKKISE